VAGPVSNPELAAKIRSKHPDLAPDMVETASRGMVSLINYSRGLNLLSDQLGENEHVYALAQGEIVRRGRNVDGVVAVTDHRLIAAGGVHGIGGTDEVEVFALDEVSNASVKRRLLFSVLRVDTPGGELVVRGCAKDAAAWVVDMIGARRAAPRVSSGAAVVRERLEQLEILFGDGLVTRGEYNAKRRQIIDEL
jgi:Bacterial PH domain